MSHRPRPRVTDAAAPARRCAALWRAIAVAFAVFTIFARSATPTVAVAHAAAISRTTVHAHGIVAAVRAGERHTDAAVSDRHDPNGDLPFVGFAVPFSVPHAALLRELPAYRGVPGQPGVERWFAPNARGPPSLPTS